MIQADDFKKQVSETLKTSIERPSTNLKKIEEFLKGTIPNRPIDSAAWRDFRGKVERPSQEVFGEFIEVLGGLALRDVRFDAGICELAEELIGTYRPSQPHWGSLRVIPTGARGVAVTLARIVRVCYPEWTIWALPLTAREIWHLAAHGDLDPWADAELRSTAEALGPKGRARFQECLADAFATYTMGPAYAYATTTLVLDPCAPFARSERQKVCSEVRSHVIVKILELMDGERSPGDQQYKDIRINLIDAWDQAKKQAGVLPSPAEEKWLKDDIDLADLLVTALGKVFKECECSPLTAALWDQINEWPEKLLDGDIEGITLPVAVELRQVLNAAWLARVKPITTGTNPRGPGARGSYAALTANVQNLAKDVIERKRRAAPNGNKREGRRP